MKITSVLFNPRPEPKDAFSFIRELSDRSYTAPRDLKGPVRLFGRDNRYISIGPHWMINVLQTTGQNLGYKDRPKQLPSLVVNPTDGYLIIPFGEQMAMRTCGTKAKIWTEPDRTVLNVVAKNAFTQDLIAFQVHFLFNNGLVEVHYTKATTGNQTVIGACGAPDDYTEWGCGAYESLSRTAIIIDTAPTVDEAVVTPPAFPPPQGPVKPPNTPIEPLEPIIDPMAPYTPGTGWTRQYGWYNTGDRFEYETRRREVQK